MKNYSRTTFYPKPQSMCAWKNRGIHAQRYVGDASNPWIALLFYLNLFVIVIKLHEKASDAASKESDK